MKLIVRDRIKLKLKARDRNNCRPWIETSRSQVNLIPQSKDPQSKVPTQVRVDRTAYE